MPKRQKLLLGAFVNFNDNAFVTIYCATRKNVYLDLALL